LIQQTLIFPLFLILPPGSFTFVPFLPLTRMRERGCAGEDLPIPEAGLGRPATRGRSFSAAATPADTSAASYFLTTRLRKSNPPPDRSLSRAPPWLAILYLCPVSKMVLSQNNFRNFSKAMREAKQRRRAGCACRLSQLARTLGLENTLRSAAAGVELVSRSNSGATSGGRESLAAERFPYGCSSGANDSRPRSRG